MTAKYHGNLVSLLDGHPLQKTFESSEGFPKCSVHNSGQMSTLLSTERSLRHSLTRVSLLWCTLGRESTIPDPPLCHPATCPVVSSSSLIYTESIFLSFRHNKEILA